MPSLLGFACMKTLVMFTKAWQPPLCFETIKAYLPSFALHRSRKFHALGAWHYLFFMILSFFWTMIITWGGKMGSDHEILEYFTIKWRRKGFCSLRRICPLEKKYYLSGDIALGHIQPSLLATTWWRLDRRDHQI